MMTTHLRDYEARTRTQAVETKPHLVVELRSRPARYAPKSGPPSLPVTLLPAHDSTAYIVDRILLASPGLAKDGKSLPRRMTYIVGWHDLPAARVLVPAMKILEYVSPLVLENWEYDFELELEQERAELAEDKRREKEEQLQQSQPGGDQIASQKKPTKGKKKRGRPPAHDHTQIEAGAVVVPETEEEASRTRMKAGTMSLSTPQKRRLAEFADLSDDEGSPSRGAGRGTGGGSALVSDAMDVDELDASEGIGEGEVPGRTHTSGQSVQGLRPTKVTPVPLPSFPRSTPSLQQRTLPRMFTTMNTGSGISSASSSKSTTPVPPPVLPALRPSNSVPPAPAPRPLSSQSGKSHPNNVRAASASVVQPPVTAVLPPIVPPSAGSTPSVPSRPTSRPTSSKSQPRATKPPKKRSRKDKPLLDEEGMPVWIVKRIEDDAMFEVDGKEGLQHLYKVRWEGDWPPEENPTWEPVENLPPDMVRNWHKTGAKIKARISKGLSRSKTGKPQLPIYSGAKSGKMKQSKLDWGGGPKVSSVSDVFQTEVDESVRDGHEDEVEEEYSLARHGVPEDSQGEDELLLVDNALEPGRNDDRGSLRSISGERPSFAARMSSWGAFFGAR